MKKILCLFLTVMMLFPLFVLGAEAATDESSVMSELAGLFIDGERFSEKSYPVNSKDSNLYVLAVVESGFETQSSSPDYGLYFYVYSPSCIDIKNDARNSVQLGFNEDCEGYSFYGFKVYSKSADGRFLKLGVCDSAAYYNLSKCYSQQEDSNRRVYNTVLFRIFNGSSKREYKIEQTFYFEGFDHNNTLTSYSKKLGALDVELHSTNWISPNAGIKTDGTSAGIYDHYEINSVYFSIPKDVWDQYEYLKSIRATYDAIRLTPIVVTRPGDFDDDTKDAILNGTSVPLGSNLDVMDIYWEEKVRPSGLLKRGWLYSNNLSTYLWTQNNLLNTVEHVDTLSYYFESLPEDFDYDAGSVTKAVVSSEELEAYFYERYDPDADNSKLYSELRHMEIDYNSRDYDDTALYNMKTYSSSLKQTSEFNQWWVKHTTENDAYIYDDFPTQADHITVIANPSQYSSVATTSYARVANELFISENDVADFAAFCARADRKNEVVVLLRYGFSDYRCQVVKDVWELMTVVGKDCGVVIDKWAYMNISLAHIVFYKDGADYVVPTASNIVDSFGSLDATGKPTIDNIGEIIDDIVDNPDVKDFLSKAKGLVAIIVGIIVLLLVLWAYLKLRPVRIRKKDLEASRRRKDK